MEKKNKYDTNPLDPNFVRRTEDVGEAAATSSEVNAPFRPQDDEEDRARLREQAEAPTRRYNSYEPLPTSYPSVFNQEAYRPPAVTQNNAAPPAWNPQSKEPCQRTVAGIGLPERVACVLPYAPFYIGVVASLVELLLVPRTETRTRFHAAQGFALHIAIFAISLLFKFVGLASGNRLGGSLFSVAAFIFLMVSIGRVWKGETHRIAPLADATKKLNERIEPRT
ncbi:MAG: hypothetical protein ABR577_00355 [Pyrinomonadaceae bacterium]